jgi:hypothetical protein
MPFPFFPDFPRLQGNTQDAPIRSPLGQGGWYSADGTVVPDSGALWKTLDLVGTISAGVGPAGVFFDQLSAALLNSDAGIQVGSIALGRPIHRRNWNPAMVHKFALTNPGLNVRLFVGYASQDSSVILAANDPVAEMAGIQFDTSVGDVNFMAVRRNGVGPIQRVDTGIARDATAKIVEFAFDDVGPKTFMVKLYDDQGAVLYREVFTDFLPAGATDLVVIARARTLNGTAKTYRSFYGYGVSRKR